MQSGKPLQPKSAKPEVTAAAPASTPSRETDAAQAAPTKTSKSVLEVKEQLAATNPRDRGFDPYNSGVFNAKDTWSRVNRKK